MDKVFRVELFGEKTNRWCELELPATYYGLLDALDTMALSSCKTIWPMNAISISLTLWQPVWDR